MSKKSKQLNKLNKSKYLIRVDHDEIHDLIVVLELDQEAVNEIVAHVVEVAYEIEKEDDLIVDHIQNHEQDLDHLEEIEVEDMTVIVMMIMIEAEKQQDIDEADQDLFLDIEDEELIGLNQDH